MNATQLFVKERRGFIRIIIFAFMRSLLFLLFFMPFTGFSQKDLATTLDSIQGHLDTISDENKLFLTSYQIAEQYLNKRPQISITMGEQMLAEAEKEENHRVKTSALYLLGRGYFNNGQPLEAEKTYQKSVEYELSFEKVDTAKLAWVYHNAANYYKKRGDYLTAIDFFEKSYKLEKKRGNLENQASCQLNIGAMYLYLGRNSEAKAPLEKSKNISLSIGDTSTAQSCINNIALIYHSDGDYTKALQTLDSAFLLAGSLYDKAYIYGDQAMIHQEMGNTAKAIQLYELAQEAFDKMGYQLEKGQILTDIGTLFRNEGDFSRPFKLYKEAENIFKTAKNKNYLAATKLNLGQLFAEQDLQDSTKKYLDETLILAKEVGNIGLLGKTHLALGEYSQRLENYSQAIISFKKALNYFNESNDVTKIVETQIRLAQCEQKTGNKNAALQYIKSAQRSVKNINQNLLKVNLYETIISDFYSNFSREDLRSFHLIVSRLKDSIRSDENAKAVAKLGAKYQLKEMTDSIHFTNQLLKRERAVRQAETKVSNQRRNLLWVAGIGSAILIVLIVLLVLNRRKIHAKSKENEILLGEIHHRVKNNLQVISSLLSLQEKNIQDESAKKAISDGKTRVKSIGLIHKLLYQKDNFSGINMREYTEHILTALITTHGYQPSDIATTINVDVRQIDVDTAIPIGLIINELVNNSLKYAFSEHPKKEIAITFKTAGKSFELVYSDNGSGKIQSLEGTNSFGYRMIQSLTRQLNGSLNVSDQKGLHYRFTFSNK